MKMLKVKVFIYSICRRFLRFVRFYMEGQLASSLKIDIIYENHSCFYFRLQALQVHRVPDFSPKCLSFQLIQAMNIHQGNIISISFNTYNKISEICQ